MQPHKIAITDFHSNKLFTLTTKSPCAFPIYDYLCQQFLELITMRLFHLFLIPLLAVALSFMSCSRSPKMDLLSKNLSSTILQNDTTFIFIGMEWCQGSTHNFTKLFATKCHEAHWDGKAVAIFFSSEQFYDDILKNAPYSGQSYRIDSHGGIVDRIYAHRLLKKIIPHYKKVNYVPVMIAVDADGNYRHWPYQK